MLLIVLYDGGMLVCTVPNPQSDGTVITINLRILRDRASIQIHNSYFFSLPFMACHYQYCLSGAINNVFFNGITISIVYCMPGATNYVVSNGNNMNDNDKSTPSPFFLLLLLPIHG